MSRSSDFDLPEGDQEALLELGIQPKKAGGVAEVPTGCNQSIHLSAGTLRFLLLAGSGGGKEEDLEAIYRVRGR